MNKHTNRTLAVLAAGSLLAAACGNDEGADDTSPDATATSNTSDTTAASDTTASPDTTTTSATADTTETTAGSGSTASAASINLSDVCPDPLVIQTDWFPESEHGALYEMVGDEYEVDTDAKRVTGPLVAGGQDTGISVEVRTGGPAIGFNPVASTLYTDDSIHIGYANTESQVLQTDTPLVSVLAPLEINPQIIMWDPETYPDIKTLADLGEENVTINVFSGGVFSEVFVAEGIWSADQVDPSYEGVPARFVAEGGKIAQQGFASAEPYNYEEVFEEWGKPVDYQLLHDAGFEVYSQTLGVRRDDLETLGPCLEQVVPVIQQSAVDYINEPDRTNGIIVDIVEQFDDVWVYDEGVAKFSVETQKELGLVGNGPDDTLGNMDEARIQGVIDQMREAGMDVPADLEAADLFTNEFIDTSIGL
ncbi:MAG: ABC transporter substrate-binding protein [Actinomycetota bacterium]|nr:ABC transporter substrate-binding protein [Actinomycetota bacterium]